MLISAIVARATNGAIGKANRLPWHLPADLAYFKQLTTGHHLVMGRKTFDSIGKPLPNRTSIVLTRQAGWTAPTGVLVVPDWEQAIRVAQLAGETELFVIGGAEIFLLLMPSVDRLYSTEIHAEVDGDVFLPAPHPAQWRETSRRALPADTKNEFAHDFVVYERIVHELNINLI